MITSRLHPERQPNEEFLTNIDPKSLGYIGYLTKRTGRVAYSLSGKPVYGLVPVFVSREEYEKHNGAGSAPSLDTD